MSGARTTHSTDQDPGLKYLVSQSGLCGVTLDTEGEHAGFLFNFVVSPREDIRATYALMNLVLDMGANKLVAYAVPLVTSFFELFGFQAVAGLAAHNAPPNWIADIRTYRSLSVACPDFVFMALKVDARAVSSWLSRGQGLSRASDAVAGWRGPCENCSAPVSSESYFDLFGGYECKRCRFVYACGTLMPGVPQLNPAS